MPGLFELSGKASLDLNKGIKMKSIGEGLGSPYDKWIASRIDAYDQGKLSDAEVANLRNWREGVDLFSDESRVIHNRASEEQTLAWLYGIVGRSVGNPIDDDDLLCNRAALSNFVARLADGDRVG